jgi:hypothetical protein
MYNQTRDRLEASARSFQARRIWSIDGSMSVQLAVKTFGVLAETCSIVYGRQLFLVPFAAPGERSGAVKHLGAS